jgi:predicted metal-dependent HD superfamily phosphohydrolase
MKQYKPIARSAEGWVDLSKKLPPKMLMEVSKSLISSDNPRYYHDCLHIGGIWATYNSLFVRGEETEALMFAAAYHDIVYDVSAPKGMNEYKSSIRFIQSAMESGVDKEVIENASLMILSTSDHWNASRQVDKLFCDIDLCGFACEWEEFCENTRLLNEEFASIDREVFEIGRKNFLESVLAKPKIFQSPFVPSWWEEKARENISRVLEISSSL